MKFTGAPKAELAPVVTVEVWSSSKSLRFATSFTGTMFQPFNSSAAAGDGIKIQELEVDATVDAIA